MTEESAVKKEIRESLRKLGWHYRSMASNEYTRGGLPDAYAVKNGVVLFIECKSKKGKQSVDQIAEMAKIYLHGGNYILARGINDIIEYCKEWGIKL